MPDVQAGLGCQVDVTGERFNPASIRDAHLAAPAAGVPSVPSAPHLTKYYMQRHRLFHRFSDGIMLDNEGWYSVTPEKIAAHHAQRLASTFALFSSSETSQPNERSNYPLIIDAFCGAGGNAIQFAAIAHVVAIDISPARVAMAANNARVYGVAEYIDFIVGDVHALLPSLAALCPDSIFMSPPWGGPGYINSAEYDIAPFTPLVKLAKSITPNFAILLPRNISEGDVQRQFGACELERNYLGNVLKTSTVYFGNLQQQPAQ
jgi:trimethylguanosine synthase